MNQNEFMLKTFNPGDTVSVPVDSLKELISDKNISVIVRDEAVTERDIANNKLEVCYDRNEELIAELSKANDMIRAYKKAIAEADKKISKTLKLTKENDKLKGQVNLGVALRCSLRNQLDIEKFNQPRCPESVTLDTKA